MPRQRIVRNRKLRLAQPLDLVAQARGRFELEIGGGFFHAPLHVGDDGLQIMSERLHGVAIGEPSIDGHVILLVDRLQHVVNVALDALRCDAVGFVPCHLLLATAVRLRDGAVHRAGHLIRIQNDFAVDVARGASDGLHQRRFGAQKTFLVGIENGDERALRNVETFAQQVDADQHVEGAEPQIADDFNAFQRLDIGVHVADAYTAFVHVFGEVFRHALRQHSDERAVAFARDLPHFVEQIVDLRFRGSNFDDRIDKPCRPDDLLRECAAGLLHFPARGRRRDEHRLRAHRVPLFKAKRAIVHARRQPESVFRERGLAPEVAAEHAADLRNGDVALVGKNERVVGQIFKQRRRRIARIAPREIARIVLDAGARARRLHHLHVERGALFEALRFEQLACVVQLVETLLEFYLDRFDRLLQRWLRRDVVRVRVELDQRQLVRLRAGQRIELDDAFDFIAEQREAPRAIFQVSRKDFDRIAARAE